jgi:RNA polymerase sigma factor (sigma-70 family)
MLNTLSEQELALRYRDGDLAAFDELYRRYSPGLYGFIACCAPRRDRIDELVLDSWAVLHQARGRYLASASFHTFLYQVAHTRLVELMRHEPDGPPAATLAATQANTAEDDGQAARLRRAIRALPDEGRETLALRVFGGLGLEEIALLCAAPLDTVTTRLRDALQTLRSQAGIDATGADSDPAAHDVGTILRGLLQETPPPELDARIRAQARAALDHPARVARDPVVKPPPAEADAAADDEEAPRPSNPFGHLRVPMAVAAVLVIGVTLALQLGDWRTPADPPADSAGARGDQPAPATDAGDPASSIGALLDQHRDAEAREAWRAFRQLHPDAPVPDALRARLEALPPAR